MSGGKSAKEEAFKELLWTIGRQIPICEVSALAYCYDFTEQDKERCKNGTDILIFLDHRGDIGPDKTSKLKKLMKRANIGGSIEKVEAYEKEHHKEPQKEHQQPLLCNPSPVLAKVEASPVAGSSMGPPPLNEETGVSPISGRDLAQRTIEERECNEDSSSMEDIERARKHLREVRGDETADLYPYQERTINNLLAGKSTLLICRTGGGKSAAYFLATKLLRERKDKRGKKMGPTLVISPLVSLMNDQVRAAERFDLTAVTFNSSTKDLMDIQKKLRRNRVDILFVSPEMLSGNRLGKAVPQLSDRFDKGGDFKWLTLAMIVIDEIHCVSDWGHDFRPAYFSGMRRKLQASWTKGVVKLGTSATVPLRVMENIQMIFAEEPLVEERSSLMRPGLEIRIVEYIANDLPSQVAWVSKERRKNPDANVLLFAREIDEVNEFAEKCGGVVYHGQMDPDHRRMVENDFTEGKTKFVCSTIALSMGFDKRDIDTVILAFTPATLTSFYQMIGRAGRADGMDSIAYVLPKQPWYDKSLSREQVIRRAIDLAGETEGSLSRVELVKYLTMDNLSEKFIQVAMDLLTCLGCLRQESEGVLRLNRRCAEEQMAIAGELMQELGQERIFMENLAKPSTCVWAMILMKLGEKGVDLAWKCDNCSFCDPSRRSDTHTDIVDALWTFPISIEGWMVPCFSFGRSPVGERPTVDAEDLEEFLDKKNLVVRGEQWELVYIPGSHSNEDIAQKIATHFDIPCSSYVTPLYPAGADVSLLSAQNKHIRDERLAKKFPPAAFDQEEMQRIANGGKNILFYDDAVKSGSTARHVFAPLLKKCSSPESRKLAFVVNCTYGRGFFDFQRHTIGDDE